MDFQGTKRKDLQALCKKYGIPANLKNAEMISRLALVFEKETEEIVTETKKLLEDTVEVEDSNDNLVVGRKAKKVRFSPENEVFEFTRSVKQQRKWRNVRSRSEIEVRRSTRIASKGVTVAKSSENELNSIREIVGSPEKECVLLDATDVQKVPRRLKRIGSSGSTQEEECRVLELIDLEQSDSEDISKGLSGNNQEGSNLEKVERRSTRLIAKRSKGRVDNEDKEDELVKNNGKEVSMDVEVQETGKYQSKDVQDPTVEKVPRRSRRFASEIDVQDPTVEKVCRRSSRFASEIDVQTNTQDQRKSMRLKESPSTRGETSDGRPLCSARESKEERKAKQSKRFVAVNSQEGELVKNKAKEPLIDCEVQKMDCMMKVQDDSGDGKVPRRSKRFGNDVNMLMAKRPLVDEIVKAMNHDDHAHKDDEKLKRTSGNDCEDEKLLRRSKRTALDNMRGQAMANLPKTCSVIHRKERDGASVDNVKKLNVNDEMQVRVRFTRNSSRIGSCKAPVVVEGNPVEKKVDGTFDSLVKSSKKVAKKMKRDRSAKPVIDIETAVTQSNLTPEKLLDEYAQFEQKAGGANVEARVSSKKSKTVNQECVANKPEGMIEDSPSSSETKAAEFVMIIENVLDSTTQECGSELVEGEHVEKNEQDTVLMAATKEKEDTSMLSVSLIKCSELKTCLNDRSDGSYLSVETTSPPTSLQLAMRNPEAELGIPTGHILVKDIVSTVITEEDTKSKEDNLICTPRTDLAKVEERNLMLMEQLGEDGNMHAADSVTHQNDEAEESRAVVFTTPEKVLLLGELYETEKEEDHTSTKFHGYLAEETTPCPPSLRLAMSNPEAELGISNGHNLVKDIVSTVITEEDTKTQEDIVVCTPRTDLKEHSSVANLAKAEVTLENLAECGKEIHSCIDDEKNSLEKDLMALSEEEKLGRDTVLTALSEEEKEEVSSRSVLLIKRISPASVQLAVSKPAAELVMPTGHTTSTVLVAPIVVEGNSVEKKIDETLDSLFKPSNKRGRSAEPRMDIVTTVTQRNLTPEKLVEEYAQFEQEDAGGTNVEARGSSKKSKTMNQECVKDRPESMIEDSPSSSETKAAESMMVIEEVLDSTPEKLVDSFQRTNTQVLNSEIMEGESGEKLEQDPVLVALVEEEKEEVSSRSVLLNEREQPALVQLAGSNPEAKLVVPTGHTLAKDVTSTSTTKKNTKIKESELKEHNAEAKLVKVEAILENLAECWKKIHLSKDDEEGTLDKEVQAANLHGNLSECNTENSNAEEEMETIKVGCMNAGHCVDDEKRSLEKEHNVSECLEEEEMKAVPQSATINKAASNALDESAVFTTPERNLLLMEQLSENGKNRTAQSVTHQNDEAVESLAVVFTTSEKVLFLGDSELDKAEKEEDHTATKIPDAPDAFNATPETKQRKRDLVDLSAFDIQKVETIIEAERDVSLNSCVLALPAKDNSCEELRIENNSETIGEISSHLEVAGMVSEESGPSTDIQNHLNDALEGLTMKGNNKVDELIEATVTKNTQIDCKGNLLLESSGNSFVSEKTCVLAGSEYEHLGLDSEVEFKNTCEKSGHKSLENHVYGPPATAFAADEEVIRRENTTPSPEETMKEYSNTFESGMLSEKQVRGEPLLIYGTQVKPNAINKKENVQNSKIVHNLNITAPRTTKRKPLQDLRNN